MFSSYYFLVMGLLLLILIFVVPPLLAARKGYKWYLWIFALGMVGLIVLAFLPFANKPQLAPEEQLRLRKRGNMIGGVLTAVNVGWVALNILVLLLMAAFTMVGRVR